VNDFPRKGIVFKDITPLLLDPALCAAITKQLAANCTQKVDAVAGIESRGFLWGVMLAQALNVPFLMIRKQGKLPATTAAMHYNLEYGTATIEIHQGFVTEGMHVLIHDDLLATGGTAEAAAKLIMQEGGLVAGYSFLVELGFLRGRELLQTYTSHIDALVEY
jgi:adenine phosphoribosyltransferase